MRIKNKVIYAKYANSWPVFLPALGENSLHFSLFVNIITLLHSHTLSVKIASYRYRFRKLIIWDIKGLRRKSSFVCFCRLPRWPIKRFLEDLWNPLAKFTQAAATLAAFALSALAPTLGKWGNIFIYQQLPHWNSLTERLKNTSNWLFLQCKINVAPQYYNFWSLRLLIMNIL